jgi:hypothetical protein
VTKKKKLVPIRGAGTRLRYLKAGSVITQVTGNGHDIVAELSGIRLRHNRHPSSEAQNFTG